MVDLGSRVKTLNILVKPASSQANRPASRQAERQASRKVA